jgi:hypothetical protein
VGAKRAGSYCLLHSPRRYGPRTPPDPRSTARHGQQLVRPQARPRHQAQDFIFEDHHDQLRDSIRRFALKELAPHAEEWEETTFPDWVFKRMGELGFLGLSYPEQYGGQGGDSSLIRPR